MTEEVFMAWIPAGRVHEINEEIVGFPDMNYIPCSGNEPWVFLPFVFLIDKELTSLCKCFYVCLIYLEHRLIANTATDL